MTDLRQAAQQALEALEFLQGGCTDSDDGTVEALTVWCPEVITALKAALEQPEQEPTPWRDMVVVSLVREGIDKHKARELADHFAAERPWQGLTDEEMSDIVADMDVNFGDLLWKVVCLTKIIEAKLKGMNT
jgi:hypothetical protein